MYFEKQLQFVIWRIEVRDLLEIEQLWFVPCD